MVPGYPFKQMIFMCLPCSPFLVGWALIYPLGNGYISHQKSPLKMIFLFPLVGYVSVPWRVRHPLGVGKGGLWPLTLFPWISGRWGRGWVSVDLVGWRRVALYQPCFFVWTGGVFWSKRFHDHHVFLIISYQTQVRYFWMYFVFFCQGKKCFVRYLLDIFSQQTVTSKTPSQTELLDLFGGKCIIHRPQKRWPSPPTTSILHMLD